MITIAPEAVAEMKNLIAPEKRDQEGFRIGVDKGGCSGLQYLMLVDQPKADDEIIDCGEGVRVLVDKESMSLISGSVIAYEDGLTNAGFRIQNPHAKQTCGCGTSFEA